MDQELRQRLAEEIRNLAREYKKSPIVGAQVNVTGTAGGGSVTGLVIEAQGSPDGRPVIGMRVSAGGGMEAGRNADVQTMLEAADGLEAGNDPSFVSKFLSKVQDGLIQAGFREAIDRILSALG